MQGRRLEYSANHEGGVSTNIGASVPLAGTEAEKFGWQLEVPIAYARVSRLLRVWVKTIGWSRRDMLRAKGTSLFALSAGSLDTSAQTKVPFKQDEFQVRLTDLPATTLNYLVATIAIECE
jgi:hypothetical protein